ncbi:MAG: insulinase family protein [Bacteroidetes bacterium]|nr:insulinase family protein [Bacteroidota bacterium]
MNSRPILDSIHERILSNGLHVVIAPNHKAPVVCVTVGYKVGSKDELPTKNGFAHLFEHLMFDGSTNVARGDYFRIAASAGGSPNAYTAYDQTIYHITVPTHQIELALWIESDRMMKFGVQQIGLETQQKVVTEEISEVVENQPYGSWRTKQAEIAFSPNCSYSWEVHGSKAHVAAATMDDVQEFFDGYYRPDNAILTIAGDINPDAGFALAEKYFGDIPRGKNPIRRNSFTSDMYRGNQYAVITDNVPLPAVFMSFHSDSFFSDNSYIADILSGIIGEGRSSRFYRSLVYDKQIASSASAFNDQREMASLFTVSATASSPEITCDELSEALLSDITLVCEKGIEESEIFKSRNSLATGIAYPMQTCSGIADILTYQTMFWNNPNRINTLLSRYNQFTAQEVQEYANKILRPENMVRVDVVPNVQ